MTRRDEVRDLRALPAGNPYDFYRDLTSWYRMIDPRLADPARRYAKLSGGVEKKIVAAIDAAERFHTELLVDEGKDKPFYHPHTYAFYGADTALRSFGQIRWVAREPASTSTALTPANVRSGQHVQSDSEGGREVEIAKGLRLRFAIWPQDAQGDETVPVQSGSGPQPHVRQIFAPGGFRHQDSYQHEDMLLLTRHLIVKIVQEIK